MEFHPYANIFPLMQGAEFESFCQNFRDHGFQERNAIVLFEGKILDGRNRFRACEATNTQPVYRQFDAKMEGDPIDFVITENLHRRHLTQSQMGMAAAEAMELKAPHRPKRAPEGALIPPAGKTRDIAAKTFNISSQTFDRAMKVKKKGAPELREAVVSGDITVTAAAEIAELPTSEQEEVVAQAKAGNKSAAFEAKKKVESTKPKETPPTAQKLIDAIAELHKIVGKGLMRISIVELRDVAKQIDNAAKPFVGKYLE